MQAGSNRFFQNIDPHALKISDITNPDEFVTELLNSRVRTTEQIPSEVVVESPPYDIFIEVTDDLLYNIPKAS